MKTASTQFRRLLPVLVQLGQPGLRLLERLRRLLDALAVAVQVRRRQRFFQLLQARLGGEDVGLDVRRLAVGELALLLARLLGRPAAALAGSPAAPLSRLPGLAFGLLLGLRLLLLSPHHLERVVI